MDSKLYFEGIEIGGPKDQFLAKLKDKGYIQDISLSDLIPEMDFLRGYYKDYRDICDIIVHTNDNGMVYKITITGKESYTVDAILRDFDFFTAKAEEYNLEQVCEADDSFSLNDIALIADFTKNKFVYYNCEQKNQEIFVTVGDGLNNSLNVSMVLSNNIQILNKKNITKGDKLDLTNSYTQEIINHRRNLLKKSKSEEHKFELLLAAITGSVGGFLLSFIFLILDDIFMFFVSFLLWSIGFTFVFFLMFIAKNHGYDVFPDDSNSYHGGSSRTPSMRIRKYKPTNWKTKNRDKLFY